jgi:hypothetical protein
MNFSPDDTVVVSPHQVSCRVGDDVVVLGVRDSAYFGIKGVGTFVWELIQQPSTLRDICDRVAAEFDAAPDQIDKDLNYFFDELLAADLIELRRANVD